jgi:hypothetical protein
MATTCPGYSGISYGQLLVDLAVCMHNQDCPICGQSSQSSTPSAQRDQAMLDAVIPCFDKSMCWGGETADSPGTNVRSLPSRDDFATRVSCSSCELTKFIPCAKPGRCASDPTEINWLLIVVIVEGIIIVILLYMWCKAWSRSKQLLQQPSLGVPLAAAPYQLMRQ